MRILILGGGVFLGAAILDSAGLVTRPLADTIEDVLDEAGGFVSDDRRLRSKLGRGREAELITRWRERTAAGAAETRAAKVDA
ncbi:MAG TPA: hypothetical protein VGI48_06885 [Caldimonas sp.]|jgi:hypothetical protein